jgi:hypothetical protein
MVAPLTPKPTPKAEGLTRAPPTIASSREEDAALKEVSLTRYRCANFILETKTKVGTTVSKAPDPRTNPNINAQRRQPPHRHPSRHEKPKPSTGSPTIASRHEEDVALKEVVIATVSLRELYS